jgi:hypothetical protein
MAGTEAGHDELLSANLSRSRASALERVMLLGVIHPTIPLHPHIP